MPSLAPSGVAYDAAERRSHPRCHPGTRVTTLAAIDDRVGYRRHEGLPTSRPRRFRKLAIPKPNRMQKIC